MYHDLSLTDRQTTGITLQAILDHGRSVLDVEAQALAQLSEMLDEDFARAVELVLATNGRVVVSGMGKSGHIARKMAATFASTGTPAIFIHPGEAAHGDLGMLLGGDLLVALSNSGATPELRPIMHHARRLGCPIVGITSQRHSPITQMASVSLILPSAREACPVNISPTTSTTMMLALGDALAVAAMSVRGISREALELLHPGGVIGLRLLPVNEIMHAGDQLPLVPLDLPMRDVLVTMTEKSLGIAGVIDAGGRLAGTITDGDLRRNIDRLLMSNAGEVMTLYPKTIVDGTYAEDARAIMSANKITSLFVMDHNDPEKPIGLVHIHDFNRLGLN
ncbi:KpsF/GutQ family sugar-phosphate isomerase [Sphingomonas sp. SRS2]|uniref:KpsF/GutQ family sugar-phosphate isomerase n=1 Tax=Sphingomonas sp. SRS2 TaxID=133190 RepID=UPI0006184930|nr:D-arabinose 5-phosphate [Sphingomonas sp. SRS2]